MNANEMAEAMEGRARVRRKITNREDTGDRLSDQLEQAATMLRQQQAEIEALKKEIKNKHTKSILRSLDMNEPVAIRYDFDGYGYQYMDSGSGSDWQTRVKGEFLYSDPACKHGVDDGACKECYLEATHPVKELTDEEIMSEWEESKDEVDFARAILRKASEK